STKRAFRWKPSTAALKCQSRQAVRPACLLDVLIPPQWVAPFGCDPKATLMRPASQGQARRLGGAPLNYPCVTVVLPLYYRCFIGVSPSFIPCAATAIPWGFRQRYGVCTKAALPFDSAGSTIIQIRSHFSTLVRWWLTFCVLLPGPAIQSFPHDRHATQGSPRQRTSA